MTAILCVLAVLVGVALAPQTASALIIDFSALAAGNTGSNTYTSGPVTAEAFYQSVGGYINTDATLFVHTVAGSQGFGVCSPIPLRTGCGETELDNHLGRDEMIRLTLAPGWRWANAWVSSLQSGAGADTGRLFYNTSDDFGTALPLTTFSGSGATTELELPITDSAADAPYLFFIPAEGTAEFDDYLVWKVEVVPEPATLLLLGAGLAALGALGRKRSGRP